MQTNRVQGEIEVGLMEDIINELPKLLAIHSPDHTILIHGMGSQARSFYRSLRLNESVEVLWTGSCMKNWWSFLFGFIPSQAGLVKVVDRTKLNELYLEIGGLSMCGMYFIPNDKAKIFTENIRKDRNAEISRLLEQEENYFSLIVDFDFHGGERDGEIYYRLLSIGEKLDVDVKEILSRTN
jgi:hypothetical protein